MRRKFHEIEQRLNLRRSGTPAWLSLILRALLAFALIGVAFTVHWIDRGGLRDNVDGHVSFIDVLYFTVITITTVGYGDIVPVTDRARLFDTFLLTPIRLFVWLIFLGTAYDFVLKRVWEKWRMKSLQGHLHGHTVLVGYGTSGAEAFGELVHRGIDPGTIVVIDERPTALEAAKEHGAVVLEGDATRNATLEAVRIASARAMIVSAGRDDTSILVVLTARRLTADVPISVVIRSEDNEVLAAQAGANTVINPFSLAGLLLAGSTEGPHVADYMMDLAASDGPVALRERPVAVSEIGGPLSAITTGMGLRIHRGGTHYGYWEPEAKKLEPGDVIIEVVPNATARPERDAVAVDPA